MCLRLAAPGSHGATGVLKRLSSVGAGSAQQQIRSVQVYRFANRFEPLLARTHLEDEPCELCPPFQRRLLHRRGVCHAAQPSLRQL
jgi:hypothetical protein